jgi:hypothetical protein
MLLIISDASVLIDIECGELTSAMFSLPWQFAVPDILFYEELSERHGQWVDIRMNLNKKALGIKGFTSFSECAGTGKSGGGGN